MIGWPGIEPGPRASTTGTGELRATRTAIRPDRSGSVPSTIAVTPGVLRRLQQRARDRPAPDGHPPRREPGLVEGPLDGGPRGVAGRVVLDGERRCAPVVGLVATTGGPGARPSSEARRDPGVMTTATVTSSPQASASRAASPTAPPASSRASGESPTRSVTPHHRRTATVGTSGSERARTDGAGARPTLTGHQPQVRSAETSGSPPRSKEMCTWSRWLAVSPPRSSMLSQPEPVLIRWFQMT